MGSLWVQALAVVGAITICGVVYTAADFLALHFLRPSKALKRYKRSGSDPTYALVTGASAGIGLGVAQELVRQGFGVVLLGHLAGELDEAKSALLRLVPGAAVRTMVLNAVTASPEETQDAVDSLKDLDVGILVNNVGGNAVALPPLRALATYSPADVDVVIDQNVRFMSHLTTMMLPVFTARTGARSLIISMSSQGYHGIPWLAMYSATKAFNLALSRSLSRELESSPATRHIDCLAIIPGDVRTQGNCIGLPESSPTWDMFGKLIVQTANGAISRRMRDLSPYWLHDIQNRGLPWLDEGTRTTEIGKVLTTKKAAWDAYMEKNE